MPSLRNKVKKFKKRKGLFDFHKCFFFFITPIHNNGQILVFEIVSEVFICIILVVFSLPLDYYVFEKNNIAKYLLTSLELAVVDCFTLPTPLSTNRKFTQ